MPTGTGGECEWVCVVGAQWVCADPGPHGCSCPEEEVCSPPAGAGYSGERRWTPCLPVA